MPPQIDFLEFVFGFVNAHQSNLEGTKQSIPKSMHLHVTPTNNLILPGSKDLSDDFTKV